MITDRQRLGPAAEEALVRRVAAAARAGVHLVQVRERDLDGGALGRLVERCVIAVRGTRTRIVVNDRLDVALAAGAHGVHLRADSFDTSRARRIVPSGFLIGRSVHSVAEATAADADYLIFGTVFPTSSKPDRIAAGVEALRDAVAATIVPILAVGGVTSDTASSIAQAGAAGVAGIDLFASGPGERLQLVVSALNMAFDTLAELP